MGHKYAFRSADGSNNNPANPDLGKANMPYARSVPQTHPLPRNELPDAGLVFDTLLRREKVRTLCQNASLPLISFSSSFHTRPACQA